MKKGLFLAALCVLALAVPAAAQRLYVPSATKVIALEAGSVRGADALLAGRAAAGLPAFTEDEIYQAGTEVPLADLPRPRAMASLLVGAANLSAQTASCQAVLSDRNGGRLAEIDFDVEPMSLAREDALAKAGGGRIAAVTVTCDQGFYPFAVATEQGGLTPVFAKGIGPNGPCDYSPMLTQETNGHYTVSQDGLFHNATKAHPKGIFCIKAPSQLKVARAVYEWDVTVGPWSSRNRAGLHNLAYYFLDRYRSGVVGNVNSAGPNKGFLKVMQNVGMPRGSNTNQKSGYLLQTGATYHFVYTFDATNKVAKLETFLGDVAVNRFTFQTKPGNNQTLVVRPYGKDGSGLAMVAEFGNFVGQHPPEEATIGWKYSNFKLDLTLK
jgi:hypothetical protein